MPPLPGDDQTGTASVLRGRVAHSPRSLYRVGYGRIDLMEDTDVHSYYKSARAVVRDRRRAEFQRQVDEAVREGRFVEYREPMNLGRKVTEIDIAKNPRYHRD